MLSVDQCRKVLTGIELTDSEIENIRDYLYSLIRELVRKNLEEYEKDVAKTNRRKQK